MYSLIHETYYFIYSPSAASGARGFDGGQYIHGSEVVNGAFDCHYVNLTTAKNLADIGKVGLRKLVQFVQLLNRIRKEVKRLKPQLVYVTPNACGGAFYKDFMVVQLLKAMGCKVVAHYHNKEPLAERIGWLLEDEALRKRLGAAGRAKFEREYTLARFEEKIKQCLEACL